MFEKNFKETENIQDKLILKQFKKSIFNENETTINKFKNVLIKLLGNENIDKVIENMYALENSIYKGPASINFILQVEKMNIYTISRMFIKENEWKNKYKGNNNRKYVTNVCQSSTFPKNIINMSGHSHNLWFNEFIKEYFGIESLKININNVINNDYYNSDKSRCINIPFFPFIK